MKENFYDAIIVLSHEMDIEGNLDMESSLRAEKAADIVKVKATILPSNKLTIFFIFSS